MKFANATKFDRKSGVAQWRDLRFASMEKRNPEAIRDTAHSLVPESGTADPSATLRSGRDDKFEGGGPPWHGWRRMDRVEKS
jgi:hypothetical protein